MDQLPGVKGFVAASSPIPTRTMLRRQMLPQANLTVEGKRQIAPFQHLKAQCAFKLAELVEILADGGLYFAFLLVLSHHNARRKRSMRLAQL